jgi:6-phosphogluconolactonase
MTSMTPPKPKPESRDDAGLYELEETELPRPTLPGEVVVRPTADELIDCLAADLVIHAENCVRQFGDFHLALSGGATFEQFYERLMYDPNYRRIPWRRTHLWFVEEHRVPFDDERSCHRMISETLGDHADIPADQFHPIFVESETADVEYEEQIREALAWREKGQDRLDFVLLTVDEDGATAGLFPHSPVLREQHRLVRRSSASRRAAPDAVTLTPPMINAARFIAVLVTGADRAGTLRRLVEGRDSSDVMPIKGIAPMNGELKWYLDGPAVGLEA